MSLDSNPSGIQTTKGRLQFLLRDAAIYGVAAVISRAFALLSFPLLARNLTIEEYGVLDYFLVMAGLLTTFFVFGQDSVIARYFYEYDSKGDRRQLISQSLIFQLLVLSVFLPFLWLTTDWLSEYLIQAKDRVILFKIVLLQLPFLLLINFSQNVLKWTFERGRFLIISLGYAAFQASLLALAVLEFNAGILGLLVISLVNSVLFGILGVFYVRTWLLVPKDFARIRDTLPFAIPYGVICVAGSLLPILERTLTDKLLGAESLGFYAVATKIAMLISLLVGAFQTAWGPFSLSIHKQSNAGYTYNWVLKLFAVTACMATLLVTLLAPSLVVILATERYLGGVVVIFPLVMGLAIQAIGWITEIGIGISKKAYLSLYAYSAAILATLIAIYVLTPIFGLQGVGLAVLVSHLVKATISSWLAQRVYELPWQFKPVIIVVAFTIIIGFLSQSIRSIYAPHFSTFVLVAGLVFLPIIAWMKLMTREERYGARVGLGNLFNKLRSSQ